MYTKGQAASMKTVLARTYNTTPRPRQILAVEKLVENGGNVSKAMRDAGYSLETAKEPGKLTRSKGFKELMAGFGLTDQLVAESLTEDIKSKTGQRVAELRLAADILGMANKQTNVAVQVNVANILSRYQGKQNT